MNHISLQVNAFHLLNNQQLEIDGSAAGCGKFYKPLFWYTYIDPHLFDYDLPA